MPVHIPGQRRRWHWTIRMYPSCTPGSTWSAGLGLAPDPLGASARLRRLRPPGHRRRYDAAATCGWHRGARPGAASGATTRGEATEVNGADLEVNQV